ncbi:tetratricopeptide repeat protein [Colwellia sp. E150_009]
MKSIISLCLCATLLLSVTIKANELSYIAYIDSNKRIKCMYGYVATKTGDHQAAIQIFEDCIERWNDVYSMIWLAELYELGGVGVDKNSSYATSLMKKGALLNDEAGYSSLARYHYGTALYEGKGTKSDPEAAKIWLQKAESEGIREAGEYLKLINM